MSFSPTNILQRLQQLRSWQESQEELLKKTKNMLDGDVSTGSDYRTIEGLSAFDSPKSQNWESQVISPTKNFNELLEEKLAEDPGPGDVAPKVKKPFLKKGTGLERFRLKQPLKPTRQKVNKTRRKSESSITPLRAPDLSVKPRASWSTVSDSEQVKKINDQLKEPLVESVQDNKNLEVKEAPSDQTLFEKQLEKELLIFEALEQRADNSSFCSTNSSVMRILSSTPSKIQPIPEEKRVHWESSDDEVIETNLEKKDIAEILLRLKCLAENNGKLPSVSDPSDEDNWSTSEDTSVTSTEIEQTLKLETKEVGVGTEPVDDCVFCNDSLKKKILEYEEKTKEVLNDKNRLNELKKQLEFKEREFQKKKREFEDEKQDLRFELETEKKKLIREKQAFQTFMKDAQNRPNKKERQEISNLKQEVADLSETLKLKESKNGMCQARLRNQIKQLEKENQNLKDEVEKLTKENAKLSASQKLKRKSSDSKILQEINRNVTKLTQGKKQEKKEETRRSMDAEDSFLEMETNRLEMEYGNAFRNQDIARPTVSPKRTSGESLPLDKTERRLENGSREIKYSNGNLKIISPDGNFITIQFFNGDKQETNLLDGTVKYFFANKDICQTSYADGLEIVEFPEGVIEKRYTDGKCEVVLPDGVVQTTFPDGTQETKYTDGSVVSVHNGEKILLLPNGQKEIETKEYKRREYPDGTVKILYPDGTQETKYANGRVRIKDGNGTLIIDTQS